MSPYKGFSCAHRALHGDDSCSEYTKQQILEKGIFRSLQNIKHRFIECGEAAFTIRQNSLKHKDSLYLSDIKEMTIVDKDISKRDYLLWHATFS